GRRKIRLPRAIELVLDPVRDRGIGLGRRTASVGRRHHAGVQLLDDLLPGLPIRVDMRDVERLERQVRDALDVVVAIRAVLSDGRARDVLAGRRTSCDGYRDAAGRPPKRYPLHSPSSGPSLRTWSVARASLRGVSSPLRARLESGHLTIKW